MTMTVPGRPVASLGPARSRRWVPRSKLAELWKASPDPTLEATSISASPELPVTFSSHVRGNPAPHGNALRPFKRIVAGVDWLGESRREKRPKIGSELIGAGAGDCRNRG